MIESILFIAHEASRSGAPLVLLRLQQWLVENTDITVETLFRNGGPLEKEFAALGPVYKLDPQRAKTGGLATRLLRRGGLEALAEKWNPYRLEKQLEPLQSRIRRHEFDLLYSNTISNGRLLNVLAADGVPILCHVHEPEELIRPWLGTPEYLETIRHARHYIANSELVRANLEANHGIERERLSRVYEFINLPSWTPEERLSVRTRLRECLGVPQDTLIVGGCGYIHWLKGPDLFLQLAMNVRKRFPSRRVDFVWVGGGTDTACIDQTKQDVDRAGLGDHVHFVGEQANALEYIGGYDVFALTSRFESLGIVCLEAASVGVPSVSFSDTGVAKELLQNDPACVAPALDVAAMTDRVCALLNSQEMREDLGRRSEEKVRQEFSTAMCAPRILEIIACVVKQFGSQPQRTAP
jgi:glycosyltransferase involved in cell wall biosynthesis